MVQVDIIDEKKFAKKQTQSLNGGNDYYLIHYMLMLRKDMILKTEWLPVTAIESKLIVRKPMDADEMKNKYKDYIRNSKSCIFTKFKQNCLFLAPVKYWLRYPSKKR